MANNNNIIYKGGLGVMGEEFEVGSFVFIRCGRKYVRINYLEISHIESVGNYAKFHVAGQSYLALLTIKSLAEQLPDPLFFKVNRGVVVNILHIHSFGKDGLILTGGTEFSFGEDAYYNLLRTLPLLGRGNFNQT